MPQRNSGDELSLRHLPDVSDTSFSFQIPGTVQEENLLAEDDMDFFRGADVSGRAPPVSPPTFSNGPLTLSQLTPRPALEKQARRNSKTLLSFPTSSYKYLDDANMKQENTKSRVQRPELSKLHADGISSPSPRLVTATNPHLPPAEGSPSTARLATLRADVDSLNEALRVRPSSAAQELAAMDNQRPKGIRRTSPEKKLPLSRQERREKLPSRTKKKVIEGGITKARAKSKLTEISSCAGDAISVGQPSPVFPSSKQPVLSEDLNGDESIADMSMGPGGGAAERLVQYSQKLINSFGLFNSDVSVDANNRPKLDGDSHVSETGKDTNVAQTERIADSDRPLTLSQLSPRKDSSRAPTPGPTPPANVPLSPLRSSSKRPASAASETHQRKKSKTDASADVVSAPKPSPLVVGTKLQLPATRKHPRPNASGSSSSSRPVEREISKIKARGNTIAGGRSKESNDHDQTVTKSTLTSSSTSSSSKLRNSRPQYEDKMRSANTLLLQSKNKASSSSKLSDKPAFQVPLHATKPVAFQSHTESRVEVRKVEHGHGKERAESQSQSQAQSQREKKYHVPIPDFKAMHAAQEAKLALLKENIHPTVPLPIKWETDQRVKERQKFDEMVREKEREQARLMEERRVEREEQEERELRELRKKAIPKAHEVPEWYKEAPRKKDKQLDSLGR
ncbi:hypothetical protein BDZ97DRAFT_1753121 [Flammula alnicola]|nr:hypothetical protein BDZ97DRAFT_1753121 [Flammula alnicola]